MQGAPRTSGFAGAEIQRMGVSGYRVARTDSAPHKGTQGTKQTHLAHGPGSLLRRYDKDEHRLTDTRPPEPGMWAQVNDQVISLFGCCNSHTSPRTYYNLSTVGIPQIPAPQLLAELQIRQLRGQQSTYRTGTAGQQPTGPMVGNHKRQRMR